MTGEPSGFASRDFRIGDRVRFLPHAEVSDRVIGLMATVEGYDMTPKRSAHGRTIDDVHVIVLVTVGGKPVEQWVAPDQLVTVH